MRLCGQILHIYRFYSIKQNIPIPKKLNYRKISAYMSCTTSNVFVYFMLWTPNLFWNRVMLFMIGQSRSLCKTKIQVPALSYCLQHSKLKVFLPPQRSVLKTIGLWKMFLIVFQKRETKKQPFHTLPQFIFIQLLNMKLKIEKVINFFFIFIQKKGVSVQYRFYILRPFTFFLIHSPKTEVTAFVPRWGKWK